MGAVIGVILTVLESTRHRTWVPSPTGIGIGCLIPGSYIITMWIGGALAELWRMMNRANYERHVTPLASGFIVGEAIVAVMIPILVAARLLHLQP